MGGRRAQTGPDIVGKMIGEVVLSWNIPDVGDKGIDTPSNPEIGDQDFEESRADYMLVAPRDFIDLIHPSTSGRSRTSYVGAARFAMKSPEYLQSSSPCRVRMSEIPAERYEK